MTAKGVRARGVVMALVLSLAIPAVTASFAGQSWIWTFRVTADPAPVRARPDAEAPPIDSLAKGRTIKSYATEGAWSRVIITRKDGSVVIGYVSVSDLELLDQTLPETADLWTSPADSRRGAGFLLHLSTGLGTIGGGSLVTGSRDLFKVMAARLQALRYQPTSQDRLLFQFRTSFNGELLYRLSPRFAVGLGATLSLARSSADISFREPNYSRDVTVLTQPSLTSLAYCATASCLLPISERVALRLSGGPMLAAVRYSVIGSSPVTAAKWSLVQAAHGMGLGAHAAAALELNLGARKAFFIEVAARDGSIRGIEGTEQSLLMNGDWVDEDFDLEGPLYAVRTGRLTRLMVLNSATRAPGPFREATYSLLGIDIRIGLRVGI